MEKKYTDKTNVTPDSTVKNAKAKNSIQYQKRAKMTSNLIMVKITIARQMKTSLASSEFSQQKTKKWCPFCTKGEPLSSNNH